MSVPRVAIRDLGDRGDKEEIRRLFAKFGTLKNVWVADNPPGFAYVFYYSFRDAEAAVRHMDGQRVCGMRVRVELTPIEDRRAGGRGGGFVGRGRGGYRSDSRGQMGGPPGRSSFESRDYNRDGRGSQSNFRGSSRSSYGDYGTDRGESMRSRERSGVRSNYDRNTSYGGRGRGRGSSGYSPRGYGSSRMAGGSGYDSGFSEPRYRYSRGRGGEHGGSYEGSRGGGYRGGGGGFRDRESHSNYEYGGNDYRQSRTSESYRGYGRRGGGMSSRRPPSSQGDYEPRQRRETRREDHREKDYHSDYGYAAHEEPVSSRGGSSRASDLEYRDHRSRPGKETYAHKEDYRRHSGGRMEYRRQSFGHGHEDVHEPRSADEYRERKPSKTYRKEEYPEESEEWEGGGGSYRDRSPNPRSPRHRHHHRHHHYSDRERSPVSKRSAEYSRSSSPHSPLPSNSPPSGGRYRREYIPREEFAEPTSGDELEPSHYEPVDQYIAGEEYQSRGSRTPSDYDDRDYPPEGRRVEYGSEGHSERETAIPPYEEEGTKAEDIDRDTREVEYKEPPEEGGRYVKLEEPEEPARYEKRSEPRERGRRRRYSDDGHYPSRHGSSPTQRRHRSPASPPRSVFV